MDSVSEDGLKPALGYGTNPSLVACIRSIELAMPLHGDEAHTRRSRYHPACSRQTRKKREPLETWLLRATPGWFYWGRTSLGSSSPGCPTRSSNRLPGDIRIVAVVM